MICDRGLSLTKTGSKTPRRLSKTEGKLNTKILRYCSSKLMFVVIVAIFNFRHDLALTILLWGIGRDFDIYQKIAVEFPTPGKNVRSNITKFPTPRNDLWSWARAKIQISLPLEQQENSNALPPGQSGCSKSRPMPRLLPPTPPPHRLDIDRCISRWGRRPSRLKSDDILRDWAG